MSSGSSLKNKEAFDLLHEHKSEIEARLGVSLIWDRAEDSKASRISYQLDNVSISNEANWPEMAEFQAEWSDKICGIMLEYLLSDEEKRLNAIAALFREWAQSRADVRLDTLRCSRAYTRFTTEGMSVILPDSPGALSGWNTPNHYFYEIINKNARTAHIQLAISSKNITDELRAACDRVNKYYPAKVEKDDWQWRTPFKTTAIELGDELDKTAIFAKLDSCMQEILAFEAELKSKF